MPGPVSRTVTAQPPGVASALRPARARRRLAALPRFVNTRGGEYFFVPGKRALAWLARRA